MKIAIMQPYFAPYLGYFQLIHAVDKFVFLDDVNFISRGWINRNRIIGNGEAMLFSIPLANASRNSLIKNTAINYQEYGRFLNKFRRTLEFNYKLAPFFEEVFEIFCQIFEKKHEAISHLAIDCICSVFDYLDFNKELIIASERYSNTELKGADRLIDICKQEGCDIYVNAIGGQDIYKKKYFEEQGVHLKFLKSGSIEYKQFDKEFVPWLSIIDVLMFNSPQSIKQMINNYRLI